MPDVNDEWLAGCRPPLRAPMQACAAGEVPVNIALMRMLVEASDAGEVERALTDAIAHLEGGPERPGALRHLQQAVTLLRNNPQAFDVVRSVIAGVEHAGAAETPEAGVAQWAAVFDRAARASPEAGVALYALGNPALLRDATAEVVARMRDWGLLGATKAALDVGCGIGRFEEALAHELGLCVGIDIAAEMIVRAAKRCAGLPNLAFVRTSGCDLAAFADRSFDLVFAVDSFPYLVQSGQLLAALLVREAARVLKPGGALLVLNFSYRGDLTADRGDLRRAGTAAGLQVIRDGTQPFSLWDGTAFELRKQD
jgi:tRNA G46 methylase TrmB